MRNPKPKSTKSETHVTETEARDNILEELPIGICRSDLKGTIKYVNRHFEEVTGYTRDEIVGKNVLKLGLFPDDMRGFILKRIAARIGGAPSKKWDTQFKCKDGMWIWVTLEGKVIRKSGVPVGFQIAASDITERKRAEGALRESEEKYRNVVERAKDGITIIQDGVVKFANTRLVEMWGGTVEEVLETPFANHIHPDQLPAIVERYQQRMAGEDIPPMYETVLLSSDGSKVYVEISAGVIAYLGKPADLVMVRDVTERIRVEEALRESEARYRSLVESSDDPIYIRGRNLKYLFANEKLLSRFGKSLDEVVGQEYIKFHSPEKTKEYFTMAEKVFESGKPVTYEHKSQRDGRDFLRTLSPVMDSETGKTIAITVISKDITEIKQAEAQRAAALEARRKTEEHFRKVIENIFTFIPEGLLVFTDKLNLIKQNKAFQDIVKEYANKLNYTEQELAEIISEQVKNRIINKDYADIGVSPKKDRETKNKQDNLQ
ncbi:MAG: PAS domain S-box protein [bacterium]